MFMHEVCVSFGSNSEGNLPGAAGASMLPMLSVSIWGVRDVLGGAASARHPTAHLPQPVHTFLKLHALKSFSESLNQVKNGKFWGNKIAGICRKMARWCLALVSSRGGWESMNFFCNSQSNIFLISTYFS